MFIKDYLANFGIFFVDSIKRVLKALKFGEFKCISFLDVEVLAVEKFEPGAV